MAARGRNILKDLIVGIILIAGLGSCFSSRDYVVESDYSYSGNFKKYKTYAFFNYYKHAQDSLVPDDLIKEAIKYRMSLLGYEEDEKNPNIIVGYKIFFQNFNFKGYDQPDIQEWLKQNSDLKEVYDPIKYKLLEGTMFIFLVDKKMNRAIWQGYNSGLIDPTYIDNEKFVRGTIRTIFDKYRIFAEGYIRQG